MRRKQSEQKKEQYNLEAIESIWLSRFYLIALLKLSY